MLLNSLLITEKVLKQIAILGVKKLKSLMHLLQEFLESKITFFLFEFWNKRVFLQFLDDWKDIINMLEPS